MIHTAKQLKDKVKNLSDGRSEVAQCWSRPLSELICGQQWILIQL